MTPSPEAAADPSPPQEQEGGEPTPPPGGGACAQPLALARLVTQSAIQHWFILGLGLFIGLAAAVPKVAKTGGYIRSEWTFKYGAVIIIFLCSGIGLKTKVLVDAAAAWRLHLLTQVLSLVAYPAIAYGVALGLWRTSLNASLVSGLVVCLSTSTTASTNVVFTKQAGGNEALALVNAVVGNVIGIFLTPAWIKAFVSDHTGGTAPVPYATVIKQLVITVVAPLIAGNCLQHYCPRAVAAMSKRVNLGKLSSLMILFLVWATFSNTFAKHVTADGGSVVAIVALTLGFYCTFTALALWLPISCPFARRHLRASEADAVAMAMCAGTKTVALGIPIITAVFAHNPQQGIISLPLIIYHAEQILLGNLLTKPLKRWVRRCQARDGAGQGNGAEAGGAAVPNGAATIEEGGGQGEQGQGIGVDGAGGDRGG